MLPDDLVQYGSGRIAGCVSERCDGRAERTVCGGFASHETTPWQWPGGAAPLRVEGGPSLPKGRVAKTLAKAKQSAAEIGGEVVLKFAGLTVAA